MRQFTMALQMDFNDHSDFQPLYATYAEHPTHGGQLPYSFLDGHGETIAEAQITNAERYGPAGDTPLWYSLYWP